MQTVTVEATASSHDAVRAALRAALDGGPPLLPLPAEAALAAALRGVARADDAFADVALLLPTSGSTGTPKLV